jgi:hypothetical protein
MHRKFNVFFTLRKSRKLHFPRRTSGLAKTVVNFLDSEMYWLANFFFLKIPFLKVMCVKLEDVLNYKFLVIRYVTTSTLGVKITTIMEGELDTSYIMHDVYTIPHLALVEK